MVTPDPAGSRREGARSFSVWRLWGGMARESLRVPATSTRGPGNSPPAKRARRSGRVIWLLVAVLGIVAGTVAVYQARHQAEIEHGVTGSYEIEGRCSHMGGTRRELEAYEWACAGSFRLNGRGEARFAQLYSYQSDEPRGQLTVMAAGPDDDFVWLPADVSSARKWTWSVVGYGGALVSVMLYVYFGHRRRRRLRQGSV
jgi:hypothetical protein